MDPIVALAASTTSSSSRTARRPTAAPTAAARSARSAAMRPRSRSARTRSCPIGEGGMLVLDDRAAYERAWSYKDHGKSYAKVHDPEFMTGLDLVQVAASTASAPTGASTRCRRPWAESASRSSPRGTTRARATRCGSPRASPGSRRCASRCPPPTPRTPSTGSTPTSCPTRSRPAGTATASPRRSAPRVSSRSTAAAPRSTARRRSPRRVSRPATRLPGAAEVHETSLAFLVHPTLGDAEIDDAIAAARKVFEVASR